MQIMNDFLLSYWADITPDKEAVCDGRNRMTYSQLETRSTSLAAFFEQNGITHEDRILVCLPNCCEMVTLSFAAVKLGFTMVLGNIQYKQHELQHVVDMTKPRLAILSGEEQASELKAIAPDIQIIRLDLASARNAFDFVPDGKLKTEFGKKDDSPVFVVCTSGSTGKPKGVQICRRNLIVPAEDIAQRFHMTGNDVSFVPVPLCHMFGVMGMMVSVQTGGRIVLTRKFDAMNVLKLLEEEKVSVQYCVATMYEREIDCYENLVEKPDLSRLRTGMIAGAPSIRQCIVWFDNKLGCRLLNAYGLTEAQALAMADYDDPQDVRFERCGRPGGHVQLAVRKDDGSFAVSGEVGEIVCKGPSVMLGYYEQPEETARAYTDDGWLLTGDIGKCDPDGVFTIVGRKKDLIIRGGYNVTPAELEALYYESGFVCEACVMGYPDAEMGERIAAFLTLKSGLSITVEELQEYAKMHISKYKVPDKIILIDRIPKLPNGKINKQELKGVCAEFT